MPKKSLPDVEPRPGVCTRIRTSLRAKLEAAAAENNRTLGNEIETRLEASFGSDLGALIQKAVADGIAAHEAAKAEKSRAMLQAATNLPFSKIAGQNANSYLSYGIQSAQNS